VSRNSDVPVFPRAHSAANVAHPSIQDQFIGTFENRHFKVNFRDTQHG
jgi:hypothetical protein